MQNYKKGLVKTNKLKKCLTNLEFKNISYIFAKNFKVFLFYSNIIYTFAKK